MKEKILIFIVGILLGAVIASGAFFAYTKANSSSCNNQNTQMNGGQPPEMPGGQNGENGQPPEMNGEEPPEKPDGEESNKSDSSSSSKKSQSKKSTSSNTETTN